MSSKAAPKILTETELEMMQALWSLGEGTVNQVQEHLAPERALAYTSVSTMLRILEQKGHLKSRKEGRGHIYRPTLDKDEYERRSVEHLVEKVFHGEKIAVVRQLLQSKGLSKQDLAELKKLVGDLS